MRLKAFHLQDGVRVHSKNDSRNLNQLKPICKKFDKQEKKQKLLKTTKIYEDKAIHSTK